MTVKRLNRRAFLKYAGGTTAGVAALWVGRNLPSSLEAQPALAATQTLHLRVTDARKDMVTHNEENAAQQYFWVYQVVDPADIPTDAPGPSLFALEGDEVSLTLENALDEPHNFAIPAAGIESPTVAPGEQVQFSFAVPAAGSYLYHDRLNAPVNRMMGLHGALVVMPEPANGTPYAAADVAANPRLAQLFADLGAAEHFPGLAWDEGAANPGGFPDTAAFRQYIWVLHEASPVLFAEVGNAPPGTEFDAATFVDRFLNDPLVVNAQANTPPEQNRTPQYFTIDGQSGHFGHGSPFITPTLRVGEPCLIRVLNAGLWVHSLHIHANHVYPLAVNNEFSFQEDIAPGQTDNHLWIDTFTALPLDTWDWLVPYIRPPDVPNARGIGRADAPLASNAPPVDFGDGPDGMTPPAQNTWPPIQEVHMAIPKIGTEIGGLPAHVALSPACYPMHDHSEPTQTSQGGNYNLGMIAGLDFSGDRNVDPAGVVTFPHAPTVFGPNATVAAAGPEPPFPVIDEGSV